MKGKRAGEEGAAADTAQASPFHPLFHLCLHLCVGAAVKPFLISLNEGVCFKLHVALCLLSCAGGVAFYTFAPQICVCVYVFVEANKALMTLFLFLVSCFPFLLHTRMASMRHTLH